MLSTRGISKLVLLVGGAWLVLLLALVAMERLTGVQVPTCLFKRVTGCPCPTCGSTRAMESLLRGHVGDALALNPMMTALVLLAPIWIVLALAIVSRGVSAPNNSSPPTSSSSRMTARGWNVLLAIGLIAVALNWVWVIRCGN